MKTKLLLLVLGVLVLLPLGLLSGCSNGAEDASSEIVVPDVEVVVSAEELIQAFAENEIRANQTYKGKTAEITGKIGDIGETSGGVYILLYGGEFTSRFTSCQAACYFDDKIEIEKVANLQQDQIVTIIGKITGAPYGNVLVVNAVFK